MISIFSSPWKFPLQNGRARAYEISTKIIFGGFGGFGFGGQSDEHDPKSPVIWFLIDIVNYTDSMKKTPWCGCHETGPISREDQTWYKWCSQVQGCDLPTKSLKNTVEE